MNLNKKLILIIVGILIIVTLLIALITTKLLNKNSLSTSNESNSGEATVVDEYNINIKSTKKNKIEKDGVEVEEIKLQILGDQLQVITFLKNNSSEKLDGYFIELELLDESGKELTTIVKNSNDVIEAGATIELKNYVMGVENPEEIRGAKIKTLEKSSAQKSLEQTFKSMTPDEVEKGESSTTSVTPNVYGPQPDEE